MVFYRRLFSHSGIWLILVLTGLCLAESSRSSKSSSCLPFWKGKKLPKNQQTQQNRNINTEWTQQSNNINTNTQVADQNNRNVNAQMTQQSHITPNAQKAQIFNYHINTQKTPENGRTKPMRKFGCVFQNEDYFVYANSTFNPVYGEEVEPMDFSSLQEFDDLMKEIKEHFSNWLQELFFTSTPGFYEFYDAYKTYTQNKLKPSKDELIRFYRNYVPKFMPLRECSAMAVEVLNRLIRLYPKMSRSVYLVASAVKPETELLNMLNISSNMRQPTMMHQSGMRKEPTREPPRILFDLGHVAALLRIRVEGRLGNVLLDPGLAMVPPIVIMEDGRVPSMVWSRLMVGINYLVTLPRHDYIYLIPNSPNSSGYGYLFYIGKPYCSFLMTTVKPNNWLPKCKMARRNKRGVPIASIKFDPTERYPTFEMALRDLIETKFTSDIESKRYQVPFGRRHHINQTRTQEGYATVMKRMAYPGLENILTKAEAIAQDKDFLEYIEDFTKSFMEEENHFRNV